MDSAFNHLEEQIHLSFPDKDLLENAFIHRSFLNEHKNFHLPSNEKLEFLGDSVLSLVTSIYLYKNYPALREGDYTDIKASIVRTESLSEAAQKLSLGLYLRLSKGQEQENGRQNMNILADTFEALIAVIFLQKGFEAAYVFVSTFLFTDKLESVISNKLYLSPKSRLQELLQAAHKQIPVYLVAKEEGPEHMRTFTINATFNGSIIGTGTGRSKKEAEEAAAQNAIENMK